jgi:hypothetical protein
MRAPKALREFVLQGAVVEMEDEDRRREEDRAWLASLIQSTLAGLIGRRRGGAR